jgi:hypothetical protein
LPSDAAAAAAVVAGPAVGVLGSTDHGFRSVADVETGERRSQVHGLGLQEEVSDDFRPLGFPLAPVIEGVVQELVRRYAEHAALLELLGQGDLRVLRE